VARYPIHRYDERAWPPNYNGWVVTCDVDQTYLDTNFSSIVGLASIPLEWAEDKQTIAGMATVLRALRHGPKKRNAQVPFYFLTASPPFLRAVLRRKMLIDGVQADGIICKDWKTILIDRRRPSWLKRQLAYKLCALLDQKAHIGPAAREILIGDDTESDAAAYALYARITHALATGDHCAARFTEALQRAGLHAAEIDAVLQSVAQIPRSASQSETSTPCAQHGQVAAIYILLSGSQARHAPPSALTAIETSVALPAGTRLFAVRSAYELALHLIDDGRVLPHTAARAAAVLNARGLLSPAEKKQQFAAVQIRRRT
jgi:hypothetical protein